MNKKYFIFYLLLILIFLSLILLLINTKKENFEKQYTAVIIEPRKHKALSFVLNNFLTNLSNEWNIIIMHGNQNEEYVNNIINNDLSDSMNRITTLNLNVDNLTINDYNNLLKDKNFYNNIPTEIFLIFQTDSIICEENKVLINLFLENDYDYVGAPWNIVIENSTNQVGNGGLSLRKKSKMLEIIEKCPNTGNNEDIYFSLPCVDIYKPNFDQAKEFSIETVYNEKSFGVHKPWDHLNEIDLQKTKEKCKSLDKLIELNK